MRIYTLEERMSEDEKIQKDIESYWDETSSVIEIKKIDNKKNIVIIFYKTEQGDEFGLEYRCIDNDILEKKIEDGLGLDLSYSYLLDYKFDEETIFIDNASYAFFDKCSFLNSRINRINNLNNSKQLNVDFEYSHFKQTSFSCAIFSEGNINFRNASFEGEKIAFWHSIFGKGDIYFNNTKFGNGYISFNGITFGEGNVSFENAKFGEGDVNFSLSRFGNGNVSFENAKFGKGALYFIKTFFGEGNISFMNVHFEKEKVSFNKTSFGNGITYFDYATFGEGDVIFDDVTFGEGDVMFLQTDFGKAKVSFSVITFNGYIWFNHTIFGQVLFDYIVCTKKKVSFSNCIFGEGDVFFKDCNFREVKFNGINGLEKITFDKILFGEGNLSFSNVSFKYIKFKNVMFCGQTDVYNAEFNKNNTNEMLFYNCTFKVNTNFELHSVKQLLLHNCFNYGVLNIKKKIEKISLKNLTNIGIINIDWNDAYKIYYSDDTSEDKAKQFSIIKENYHNLGEYENEDKAFVEYMRCRRESLKLHQKIIDKIIDIIGLYATSPGRVAWTIAGVWLVFGVVFSICFKLNLLEVSPYSSHWTNGFYFSALTFMTISFGGMTPEHEVVKVLASIEGFLGLFLMAYFSVAVVRKTLR